MYNITEKADTSRADISNMLQLTPNTLINSATDKRENVYECVSIRIPEMFPGNISEYLYSSHRGEMICFNATLLHSCEFSSEEYNVFADLSLPLSVPQPDNINILR